MAAPRTEPTLKALKELAWAIPLRNSGIAVSKVGERGWYQVAEDLFISTASHDPRSGNYLDDPKGPFVMKVVWTQCHEAIGVLMGQRDTVNCASGKRPPALLLPTGADGTYRSISETLGAGNFWDRNAYTREDKFQYRMIANADEAYTYYFSSEAIADDELPFAVVYLLENGRGS